MNMTLVCWSCGAKLSIVTNRLPAFAFELVQIANAAGWIGKIDLGYGRSLVFCNESCVADAITKKGTYRLRPKSRKSCNKQ